jgi:uncharacterized MAPEG superfamily protein
MLACQRGRRHRTPRVQEEDAVMGYASHLFALTVICVATLLMWVPYVLARIAVGGVRRALDNPGPSHPPLPAWAQRAKQAHANSVENLVVFAPLVLVASTLGLANSAVVTACWAYVWARLAYYAIYVAGVPVARTLAFTVGCAADLVIAATILRRLM